MRLMRRLAPYAVAVVAVASAWLTRLALDGVLGDRHPFVTFYLAVAITGWVGGLAPALVAATLAFALGQYSFTGRSSPPPTSSDFVGAAAFVVVVVSIAGIIDAMWRARRSAERSTAHATESEGRFGALTAQAPVGIFETDARGDCVYVNRRWSELSGLALADAAGRGWISALHPDDRDRVVREWYIAAEAGREFVCEYRFRTGAGTVAWIAGRGVALRDAASTVTGYLGTVTDISLQKRAEAEREELLANTRIARADEQAARRRIEFLAEASAVLSASLDYATTLDRLARLAVPMLADYVVIDVMEDGEGLRRIAVAHADPAKEPLLDRLRQLQPSPPLMGRMARVLASGEPDLVSRLDVVRALEAVPDPERRSILAALDPRSYIVVPLRASGTTIGTITFVAAESGRIYDRSHLLLAEELAARAASAIENAKLHGAERGARRASEASLALLRRMQAITDAALADLSLDSFLAEVLERVRMALGGDTATLLLMEAGGRELRVRAAVGLEEEVQQQVRVPVGQGLAGRIAASRQPVVLQPIDYGDVVSPYIREKGLRSLAGVPLIAEGRLIGVLHVGAVREAAFDDEAVTLLRLAATRVAVSLDRAEAHEAERQARAAAENAERRSAFLAEASAVLTASLDIQATLDSLPALLVPDLADICFVDVLQPDGSLRRTGTARVDESSTHAVRELLARSELPRDPRHPLRQVFDHGKAVLVRDVVEAEAAAGIEPVPPHVEMVRRLGVGSYMLVPLVARGRSLGVVGVAAKARGRYGPRDLVLVEELARRAALAVDNARLYEAAQEANRMKDEFLTTVSHELRTPLAAMMNWVRVLRQGKLTPERTVRALDVLQRAGEAQAKLIEDILDMARAVTGRLRLDMRPVNLPAVVEGALEAVRPAAEAKGIHVDSMAEPGLEPVMGDAERLQQVVWNLLANAVKFTPGGGRVAVWLGCRDDEAIIAVSDTGEGIDAAFLPYVFERFRQAERVEARRHSGLGLGLAIVKTLVEAHGGRVEARSEGPGLGSEFIVRLPLSPVAAPTSGSSSPDAVSA